MCFAPDFVASLEEREVEFVEELHRITHDSQKALLIGDVNALLTGGWIVLLAEQGSGDWNMARMIGDPASAFSLINLLPQIELQFLIPEGVTDWLPKNLGFSGSIDFFSSDNIARVESEFILPVSSLTVKEKIEKTKSFFATYLFLEESIVGYIKSTRYSGNYIEVYIEVAPDWREKGLGQWLLQKSIFLIHSWNKKLLYVVDIDNSPSLATARSCGLKKFMRLNRFLHKGS